MVFTAPRQLHGDHLREDVERSDDASRSAPPCWRRRSPPPCRSKAGSTRPTARFPRNTGNGEMFSGGIWSITGPRAGVVEALIDVAFVNNTGVADPTVIDVTIDDGDERHEPCLGRHDHAQCTHPGDHRPTGGTPTSDPRTTPADGANNEEPEQKRLYQCQDSPSASTTAPGSGTTPLILAQATITSLGGPTVVIDGAGPGAQHARLHPPLRLPGRRAGSIRRSLPTVSTRPSLDGRMPHPSPCSSPTRWTASPST